MRIIETLCRAICVALKTFAEVGRFARGQANAQLKSVEVLSAMSQVLPVYLLGFFKLSLGIEFKTPNEKVNFFPFGRI